MLLIMVVNMASIFTQVYNAKMTLIYNFFPQLLHTVLFASLSFHWANVDIFMVVFICSCHRPNAQWGFHLPFSWWLLSNQSHCNLKSKVKMSILPLGLTCWNPTIQNVGIHYAGVQKYQRMYFHTLTEKQPTWYFMFIWSWGSTPFMYLLYSWMFCGCLTWITLWANLLSVWITFLGFGFVLTSLTILLPCWTMATNFELASWYDL